MTDPARPLRIVHCFRSPVGGIFRHVRDLVTEHARAGHEVGIVCDSSTGGAHEDALFETIRPLLGLGLVRLPIGRSVTPSDLAAFARVYKDIRRLRPDVVHGHGAKGGAIARLVGSALRVEKYRVARLYSPHGGSMHFEPGSLKGEAVLRAERLLERMTDSLVFVCRYEEATYRAKVGTPRTRTAMIYNGVAEAEFEPVPPRSDAADFLYIGMLRDLKGPDVFIDAFARTEERLGRPLRGVIVGDGPDRDKYDRQIAARGLARRLGMLPAMRTRDAFTLAPVVVVPSRAEAMPYIVMEALAAGKTLIASRVGGIPEMMGADSPALARPGDAEDLSRIMADALAEPGWKARAMPDMSDFHTRFSSVAMARDMLKLYSDILSGSPRGN